MIFKKILALFVMAFCLRAEAATISCAEMEGKALHLGKLAYEEMRDNIELIDQIGLFDTWVKMTNIFLEHYVGADDKQFVSIIKLAQKAMIDSKPEIVRKTAQESYPLLLSRMTLRTCRASAETKKTAQ